MDESETSAENNGIEEIPETEDDSEPVSISIQKQITTTARVALNSGGPTK